MKLSLLFSMIAMASFAQTLNVDLNRSEVTIITTTNNQNISSDKLEELQSELNQYRELLQNTNNLQLNDGTILDIRNIQKPNHERDLISSGTGGGG